MESGAERRWWPLASGLEGARKAAPAPLQPFGAHSLELRNQGGRVLCPSSLNNKHHRLSGGTALESRFAQGGEFRVGYGGGILLRRRGFVAAPTVCSGWRAIGKF